MSAKILQKCYCAVNTSIRDKYVLQALRYLGTSPQKLYSTQYKSRSNDEEAKERPKSYYRSWVMGVTSIGFGVGLGLKYLDNNRDQYGKPFSIFLPCVSAAKPTNDDSIASGGGGLRSRFNFIADVVEKSSSPVVYIEIKDNRRVDFFTKMPKTTSNGSGFIVRSDGLILTNAHVVLNSPQSSVHIRLNNGQTFVGVVEEIDVKSDLATVRINCKDLPVMRLGKSSELRPGEFVIAMGSPLSLSNTVTAGVVSTVSRHGNELGITGKDMDYIQTDASITFGNSGGPLVNLDGEAIGINSMKVAAGISFAIPIDYAKQFLAMAEENLKNRGSVTSVPKRRYMGITMLTLTPEIIQQLQTRSHEIPPEVTHGVLVWKVIIGSPAHSGGLRPADIITHSNGIPISSASNIYQALDKYDKLNVTVIRGLKRIDLVIVPEIY